MSQIVIRYLNNSVVTKNITDTHILVIKDFIRIEYAEDDVFYIPLNNIQEVQIKGKKRCCDGNS